MAVEKCKLAFLALAFAFLMQNAVAAPRSLAESEKFSVPPELEIIGRAVVDIFKSFSDFVNLVVKSVTNRATEGFAKFGVSLFLKAHLMITSSGVQDSSLTFTSDQHFEYRVLASTLLRLRQKLDVMERFEETFDTILADASALFMAAPTKYTSASDILSTLISVFREMADQRLRQHPELKEVYLRVREKVQAEEADVTPFILDTSKMSGNPERLAEMLPEAVRTKILIATINKQFLHHSVNRITVIKKEYFVIARATLELAKKRNKVEMVQQVYDKSLRQVSSFLDPIKADIFDISKGLFKELKSNFDANPSLNQEWREVQKYVSQRHDWDRSIWDLDLVPL